MEHTQQGGCDDAMLTARDLRSTWETSLFLIVITIQTWRGYYKAKAAFNWVPEQQSLVDLV